MASCHTLGNESGLVMADGGVCIECGISPDSAGWAETRHLAERHIGELGEQLENLKRKVFVCTHVMMK